MPDIEYMSAEGLAALHVELERLARVERPEIANRIAAAAELGDLSENADYEEAKRQQAFLEGRIQTVEQLIRNAVLITDAKRKKSTVDVGSTVVIRSDQGDETYAIVGGHEARPNEGRISNESPVARAMRGKGAGDHVTAHTPGGEFSFEIISVS